MDSSANNARADEYERRLHELRCARACHEGPVTTGVGRHILRETVVLSFMRLDINGFDSLPKFPIADRFLCALVRAYATYPYTSPLTPDFALFHATSCMGISASNDVHKQLYTSSLVHTLYSIAIRTHAQSVRERARLCVSDIIETASSLRSSPPWCESEDEYVDRCTALREARGREHVCVVYNKLRANWLARLQ